MKKLLLNHSLFFACLLLFGLLLFKDPFSERTLIPNFEPYPDALYYINLAKSFIKGEGLVVERENRTFRPPIPPLYSLSLTSVFLINPDPRMFYFTNVVLAVLSMLLFYKITLFLVPVKDGTTGLNTIRGFLRGFLLFLYVTNYFIYWFPTLAMAENLTLCLFMASLNLLLSKVNLVNTALAFLIGIGFYITKYASIPLTVIFLMLYFLKFALYIRSTNVRISKFSIIFYTAVLLVLGAVFFYGNFTKASSFINIITDFSSTDRWFSLKYLGGNLRHYLNALTGGSERFLWDSTPLVPRFVAISGLLGLAVGLLKDRLRFFSLALIFLLASSVLFISTLYTYDIRYIYHAIPILLIGFGQLISFLMSTPIKQFLKLFLILTLFLAVGYYGLSNAVRIKNQISLNLKYAETPWYYISVVKLNTYFTPDKISKGQKPVVISALPPYLVDFYSNGNYTLLPLSYDQEFRGFKEVVWGENDYSDLLKLYSDYLDKGYSVYVARYGLGNEGYTNRDFQVIVKSFNTKLVQEGCFEQCNIYELSKKNLDE